MDINHHFYCKNKDPRDLGLKEQLGVCSSNASWHPVRLMKRAAVSARLCIFACGRSALPDENKFVLFLKDGFLASLARKHELEKIGCLFLCSDIEM